MLAVTQKGLGQLVTPSKAARAKAPADPDAAAKHPAKDAGPEASPDGRERTGVRRLLEGTQRGLGRMVARAAPEPKVQTMSAPTPVGLAAPSSPASLALDAIRSTRRGLESVKVVMATGLYKTAAGMVGQRVLKENAEPLRAFLCVGLRDGDAALKALTGLEESLEQGGSEDMAKGPTKRSGLFLAARNLIEYERLFGDGATERPSSAIPWEPTPPGRIDGWGRALDEVRYGLAANELEMLMLRYAADLSVEELGYVIDAPRDEVQRRLDAGLGYVRFLLEDVFGEKPPKVEEILADAFRVEPPTDAQLSAAKPKVVPLPRGTLLGDRYELEEPLGGGEFAHVYRARDVRVPGHTVALKLLHRRALTPAAREGAMRELSLIASAFHPSIVQFKDHGWFEDRLWFVMPLYEGELLLERIAQGPLPLEQALLHFERLARGLAALHAAGIRHQDIKPENIFLVELRTGGDAERPEVLPVLLDLGVAAPTGEMALAGTPMYFAPEVAGRIFDDKHDVPLTPKADVFALALSLLHAIEEPDLSALDGVEVETFLRRRADEVPPGPRDRRLAFLTEAFARWLSPDPRERPTAGELADELARLREAREPRSRTLTPPRRLVQLLVLLAVAVLVLTATLLVDAPPRTVLVAAPGAPAETTGPETTLPETTLPETTLPETTLPETTLPETEATRLLQRQLDVESRRARELEEALGELRQRQLGLRPDAPAPEGAPDGELAAAPGAR